MPFVKKKLGLDDMLLKCQYCRKKSQWDTCNRCWKLVNEGEQGLKSLVELISKVRKTNGRTRKTKI